MKEDVIPVKKSFSEVLTMFWIFFKIGALTIGGGLAMIPVIRKEFVEKQKWVDDEKLVDIFAISQSLPGVIAINSSMYLGYEMAGLAGLVAASLGVILPSYIIILVIAFFLTNIGDNIYLAKFFLGIRSAVVPLIFISAIKLGKTAIKDKFGVVIAAASICLTIFAGLDVVFIVLICAGVGYVYYTCKSSGFIGKGGAK